MYVEAMLLADEAASGFAREREAALAVKDPLTRISLSCEALKTSTRLMHVIAWLLHQRALSAGEIDPRLSGRNSALGRADGADWSVSAAFPVTLRRMIAASERLYERAAALDAMGQQVKTATPVQMMIGQLQARI